MFQTSLSTANRLLGVLVLLCTSLTWAQPSSDAAALLAKRTEFQAQLQAQAFGEPLHLVSRESSGRLEGDAYADLAQPFARVSTVLRSAEAVCALLFLHLNVRACVPSRAAGGEVLTLSVGPKQAAKTGTIYTMAYNMQVQVERADYLKVVLSAASGPVSTRDYRIVFEVAPVEGQRTFLHFGYAYSYGTLAKMAMGVYLATAGRTKIGFTVLGTGADGKPQYVQGERGSLERNVMRNFLALQAYAGVASGSPQEQTEARLRNWFARTERHAAQLHELTLDEYLHEKHDDLARVGR